MDAAIAVQMVLTGWSRYREMNMTSGLQAIKLGNSHGKILWMVWMGGADPRREA